MLEYAMVYQKAFDLLENSDGGKFLAEQTKLSGVPADNNWDRVASLLPFLKIIYDATLRLYGSLFANNNVYLLELVTIWKIIKKKCESVDSGEMLKAYGMKKNHEKYWENVDNINLMLYVAVVLDPRRKMHYVMCAINYQYDSMKAAKLNDMVMNTLTSLYEHYASLQSQNVPNVSENIYLSSRDLETCNDWHDVADYEKPITGKNFDALGWWKKGVERYPIVGLLAIPVSTVASESAFSTSGRVLDVFRSSLSSHMVLIVVSDKNDTLDYVSDVSDSVECAVDMVQSLESDGVLHYLTGGSWDPHDVNSVTLTSESAIQLWDLRKLNISLFCNVTISMQVL
uniref:HAT C-terminal dimerisation domain-containing protein n=1 Tax=Chenopodium quinoa TaxID=63459 RepID=A0A803LUN9_CHEQI